MERDSYRTTKFKIIGPRIVDVTKIGHVTCDIYDIGKLSDYSTDTKGCLPKKKR